jgi:hypothetical protein
MRRAEGTLTNGTYISVCNLNGNENVAILEAKGDNYQVLGTNLKNRNDEKVCTIPTPAGISYSYSLVPWLLGEPGEWPL